MLSSVNAFGGLSAAELLKLFGANSSSQSSSAASKGATQSASTAVSGSSANNPANAIQAILAQAQINQAPTDSSSSIVSASVTVSSPDAVQQIEDAVSLVNNTQIIAQTNVDPATHNGISAYDNAITVTAADAVNITISNGVVSATAMQSATFPNGLPSLTSIQQALSELKSEDQTTGWGGKFNGSFTLVQLPSNTLGASGGNIITFGSSEGGPFQWALVLPQDSVSVTMSDTQSAG